METAFTPIASHFRGHGDVHGHDRDHCLRHPPRHWGGLMRHLATYLVGLVFRVVISMSGMANPAKALNFSILSALVIRALDSSWAAR